MKMKDHEVVHGLPKDSVVTFPKPAHQKPCLAWTCHSIELDEIQVFATQLTGSHPQARGLLETLHGWKNP
jgi:hypothetical protein